MTYSNRPSTGLHLTAGAVAALAFILAPTLFFGLGWLLNKVL